MVKVDVKNLNEVISELKGSWDIKVLTPFANSLLQRKIAVDFNRTGSFSNAESSIRNNADFKRLLLCDAQLVEKVRNQAQSEFHEIISNKVSAFDPTLSITNFNEVGDPHSSGVTLRITLSDGSTWYRKPKLQEIEKDLDAAYNIAGVTSPFKNWEVIHAEASTWQKGIQHEYPKDLTEYFNNYGAMVAILSFMHVSDLHHENVICAGNMPVPVDFEVMNLGFIHSPLVKTRAQRIVEAIISSFPTGSGLVPLKHSPTLFTPGICPLEVDTSETNTPLYSEELGRFVFLLENNPTITHLPFAHYDLSFEESRTYAASIMEGFKSAADQLVTHGRDLKDLIFSTQNTQRRLLIRHTAGYAALIAKAFCHVPNQHEQFIRKTITRASRHLAPQTREKEIECLMRGVIPKFTIDMLQGALYEDSQMIKEPIVAEAVGAQRETWHQSSYLAYWNESSKDLLGFCVGLKELSYALPSNKSYLQLCGGGTVKSATSRISNQLEVDLIHSPVDNSRAWISVTVDMEENVAVAAIPNDVYMGTAGVVKALRKTDRLTLEDVDCYADLLQDAICEQMNNPRDLQVGYYKGVFGILGEFATLSKLRPQNHFEVADILEVLMDTCNSNFGRDKDSLDMLTGGPGILFARANSPSKGVEKLADNMISMICDSDISNLVKQKYLVGNVSFAHGASGVIAALSQYERFHPGTPYMEEAILKLLQYEEEIGKGCLLDVRFEQDVDSLQWCNGSGGALIARAIVTQTTLRRAEAVALKDLRRQIPNLIRNGNTLGNDCICHGISGSILIFEFLSDHLRSHKHELAYTAQHFKQSLAARFSVEDMKTATGISKHSKGLLVGSAGILCALGTQGYNGTIIPEW